MLPLKDTIRARSFPAVTWLMVALNAIVFIYMINMPPGALERFIQTYGLVPAELNGRNLFTFYPLITSMFLHGGWLHILSNMWILIIFGDNVEDRIGSFRFFVFYILGGLAAALLQYATLPDSRIPSIGASGAIAAVLGAYFLFFPRSRVITLIPLFIIPWIVEVPAVLFLGFWFISQLFSGVLSITSARGVDVGGIAWWAHIGGFIFGLLLAYPFSLRRRQPPYYPDQYWPW